MQNSDPAKTGRPLVSIVIPTYNSAAYLVESVESVLKQTFRDFEVILIDDGSTDDTEKIICPYLDRVRYIRKENGGPSAARNLGIRESRGEFIAFQDADDIWLPEKLELQVAEFRKHPELGVVFAGSCHFNNNRILDSNIRAGYHIPTGMIFDYILYEHFIAMPTVMVRRHCLDEIGLFEESLVGAEDYNLYLRLADRFAFGFVRQVLVKVRIHDNKLSDNLDRMCADEINNVDKIAAQFSEKRLNKRKLKGRIYARFGRYYFAQQQFEKASGCFRQASLLRSLSLKDLAIFLLSTLPRNWRDSLMALNRKRKKRLRSESDAATEI